ncbi:hypothetical protein [Zhongshania sp. BJYM1]|uniref:hypothetical protein n=1 Tax=Zhongshania aquatica TaxID=2965069 RepID=UPI0022B55BF3|nr:hypothetical protein [Marortus sp. BJYM1]
MTENTDDWLKRLADPAACETEKERVVMEAVRSGLRAADSPSQTDQLTLERLHKRIAGQGLYDPPLVRSRRTQLLGYAAVLLMGVGLVMTYTFSNKPLHEAALQVAVVSPSASESYVKQSMARKDAVSSEEHEAAQVFVSKEDDVYVLASPAASPTAAPMAAPRKPQALASAVQEPPQKPPMESSQGAYRANEFAADRAMAELSTSIDSAAKNTGAKKTEIRKSVQPVKLALSMNQWQALYTLNPETLSLTKTEQENVWILILYDENSKTQWIASLPETSKDKNWPINVEIDVLVVTSDD